jgi:hypothetical protein
MGERGSKEKINVRSGSFWFAHATGECGGCGAQTRLVALALPPGHQSLEFDGNAEEDGFGAHSWETAEWGAFLFYVHYLPAKIQRRLQAASRGYRYAFSGRTQGFYWANHCAACGALIEDHDLFCEPGGAFLPTTAAGAAAVTLERVEEALEAGAAGYACDPQFLDSMLAS